MNAIGKKPVKAEKAKSNRLAVLAADIRTAHEDVARSSKLSAERAVDAGRMIAEAKGRDDIPRGGWERWLEREVGLSHETAKRYLQLFNAVSEGRVSIPDIAEAGQIAALKAASEVADREEDKEEDKEEDTDDDTTEDPDRQDPEVEQDEPQELPNASQDELDRMAAAEAGTCVVANMREGQDEALLLWARAQDRFVRIDRRTEWGNPFEMHDDGERADVVAKFTKFYLPHKPGLLARIPSLRGKVLGCWCHPEECHGHVIADIVNDEAFLVETTAKEIADEFADTDDDMRGLPAPVA